MSTGNRKVHLHINVTSLHFNQRDRVVYSDNFNAAVVPRRRAAIIEALEKAIRRTQEAIPHIEEQQGFYNPKSEQDEPFKAITISLHNHETGKTTFHTYDPVKHKNGEEFLDKSIEAHSRTSYRRAKVLGRNLIEPAVQ